MNKINDLTGQKFNRLIVLSFSHRNTMTYFNCICDCGNIKTIQANHLKNGGVKSCGCWNSETAKIQGYNNIKHGKIGSRAYTAWQNMKRRCDNLNRKGYENYGGRGIKVCDRWLNSFENFYEDMGNPPLDLTLERIDNNKGYSKSNCKWVTRIEQLKNRRPYKKKNLVD